MVVFSLEIDKFRNLREIHLACSTGLNLIIGENASGKTSLLEALYFLSRGRSFRTRQVRELVHTGAAAFRIVAMMAERAGERRIPVGVQRGAQEMIARIDGTPVRSLTELAMQVPVLLLNPNSHQLLEGGPQQRRRFMDWGLFHGDALFLPAWRRYRIALRNRNAALRFQSAQRAVDAWDEELTNAALTLDRLRKGFCEALEGILRRLIGDTLGMVAPNLEYRRGWPQGENLEYCLRSNREQDRREGYTRLGPHRADFQIKLGERVATGLLSRGQQKLLVIALVLAQARLYRMHKGSSCILLIDDLPAELDRGHRMQVMQWLADTDTQLFITAIEADSLEISAWPDAGVFKLDAGALGKMV